MSLARQRLDAAAQRVRGEPLLAQTHARQTNTAQTVAIDVAMASYQLVGVPDLDRPTATYEVRLANVPYEVRITAADFGGDGRLTYDGFGVPDSGGTLTLQCGNQARQVILAANTGVVTIGEIVLP